MDLIGAEQEADKILEEVNGYKRWCYRRFALEKLIPFFESHGIRVAPAEDSISIERDLDAEEILKITFKKDGTILGETIKRSNGETFIELNPIRDLLVWLFMGTAPIVEAS